MESRVSGSIQVWLVEDDDDFRNAIVPRLEKRKCNVTEFTNAEDALKQLKEIIPEIIVTDIKLPGISGIDFLRKVRELDSSVPVIVLTGYADIDTAREAVTLHASDYLVKPLNEIEDLSHPISRAVYTYRLELENKKLLQQLKEYIEELIASKNRYKDLFDSSFDMVCILDNLGKFKEANQAFTEISGYPSTRLIGTKFGALVKSKSKETTEKIIQRTLTEGKVSGIEVEIESKVNEKRIAELGMRTIKENDKVVGIQCNLHDITVHKEDEKKLRDAKNRMDKAIDQIWRTCRALAQK